MPLVEITMLEGRTPEQIRSLLESLTAAVETSIGVPREAIHVIVREAPATNWAEGGVTLAEKRAAKAPNRAA
ncbi:MAG: 2-hydroxymuconate tautomerase [Candidatus Binataceae bacterium]